MPFVLKLLTAADFHALKLFHLDSESASRHYLQSGRVNPAQTVKAESSNGLKEDLGNMLREHKAVIAMLNKHIEE